MASPQKGRALVPDAMTYWRLRINDWYPDRHSQVYVLPPVHFRKVPYRLTTVCDQPALLVQPEGQEPLQLPPAEPSSSQTLSSNDPSPAKERAAADATNACECDRMWSQLPDLKSQLKKVQDTDITDDNCQQRVLYCLQQYGKVRGHAMFIVSQLKFSDYLNEPSYAAAAKQFPHLRYPRPTTLGKQYRKGEFDVLLIHHDHGLLVGEVKSVGCDPAYRSDETVARKAEQALEQVKRSAAVVKHLVNDLSEVSEIPVRTTLVLPFIERSQLLRVLKERPKLEKDFAKALNLSTQEAFLAAELCLCADDLPGSSSDCWEPSQMDRWWRCRMQQTPISNISESTYDDILARFCGPATTVGVHCISAPRLEVRTMSEAISEAGERLSWLVLTPQQIDLLSSPLPRVFLTGPPGTGKSLVLVLKGLQWLKEGEDVHVVSTYSNSLAVSRLIYHQLTETLRGKVTSEHVAGKAHLHVFEFYQDEREVDKAVDVIVAAARTQRVNVLIDEFETGGRISGDSSDSDPTAPPLQNASPAIVYGFEGRQSGGGNDVTKRWNRLVEGICSRIQNACIWAASAKSTNIPPELQKEVLSVPLRSAPSVFAEVERGVRPLATIPDYTSPGIPSPVDGPQVIRLGHSGPSHAELELVECEQCGRDIARELLKLGVGAQTANSSPFSYQESCPYPLACQSDNSAETLKHSVADGSGKQDGRDDSINLPTKAKDPPPSEHRRSEATFAQAHDASGTSATAYQQRPAPLQYRDVFVLCHSYDVRSTSPDNTSEKANGLVRGMTNAGIPVRVVRDRNCGAEGWERDVMDTAVAQTDMVTVSDWGDVAGMERKVVVWLPGRIRGDDDHLTDEHLDRVGRLWGMSRCTVQLIVVEVE